MDCSVPDQSDQHDGPLAKTTRQTCSRLLVFALAVCCLALAPLLVGCLAPGRAITPADRAVAEAARPILTVDADAVWTDAYNRLVELGPDSIAFLMRQPAMTRRAAPDDLAVLLHTSLVRLLAEPTTGPPRLSATCLETTLGVLYFDLKVHGARIGTIVLTEGPLPRAWHDLYPADFSHRRAARIDLEADRLALREWWLGLGGNQSRAVTARDLKPLPARLWRLLSRRYADRWEYMPEQRAVLCSTAARGPAMLEVPTRDYNLVRAVCICLGSSPDPAVQRHLIKLVGSPVPVVAHNACFALMYSPEKSIREVIERYGKQAALR